MNSYSTVPDFVGLAKDPKPWDATLPAPELKVPLDFCSPKEACPNPTGLATVLPNRLGVPVETTIQLSMWHKTFLMNEVPHTGLSRLPKASGGSSGTKRILVDGIFARLASKATKEAAT